MKPKIQRTKGSRFGIQVFGFVRGRAYPPSLLCHCEPFTFCHSEPLASCHPDPERSEGEGSCIAQDRLREESTRAQGRLRVAISVLDSPTGIATVD